MPVHRLGAVSRLAVGAWLAVAVPLAAVARLADVVRFADVVRRAGIQHVAAAPEVAEPAVWAAGPAAWSPEHAAAVVLVAWAVAHAAVVAHALEAGVVVVLACLRAFPACPVPRVVRKRWRQFREATKGLPSRSLC